MFMIRLFGFLLLLLPGLAGAELLQYRYTDTQGQEKIQPPSQIYANPQSGNVEITLSGGLDRKVRVELWRGGRLIASAESGILNSTNRITVASQDYYGAFLTVAAPPDAEYQVKALIIDTLGKTVQTDEYRWLVDTTPPQLGAFQYVGTTSEGSLDLFGDGFTNAIVVDKVSDTNGIARVEAETIYLEGEKTGQVAARGSAYYDSTRGQISILKPMYDWYPVHRLRYRLTFTVYDQAGNRSTSSLEHRYGSTCGDLPEPVAAHRPGSTAQFLGQDVFVGFEPWTNGNVLYENPVMLVWRLPRHNWYNENPYGIEFTPVYQDDSYVYMKVKKPLLPAPNSNDGNWSTKTTWGCKAYNDFQGTLADGVGATPKLISGDIALDGQWIGGRSTWNHKIHVPTSVTRLRAEVEARPYVQVVKVLSTLGTLTCQVPVGETRCEITLDWQPPPERDYYAWQIRLDNEAGDFYAYADYYYFYWDYTAPLIDTVTIDTAAKTATVNITDPHTTADWRNPWWRPQTVQLIAEHRDGNTVTLNPTASRNPTTNSYGYDFNPGRLPEGAYTLTVRVVDTFNNERTLEWGDYGSDNTGPDITLTVAPDDRPLQGEVSVEVLEDIRIRLTDASDANPDITDITLSGGPQHDTVHLAWRQEDDGWRLEYPVMFPSLAVGDYQLRVSARDASGNASEKTAAFSYQPHRINLIGGNTLTVPVAEHAFSRREGLPALVTELVALRDGALLTGAYDIYGTMAADGIPVIVNGVRVEPGQTVKVADGYVLGNGHEHLRLSLAAPQPGQGQLLLTLPGAPRSPVVQARINAWQAAARLDAATFEVEQILEPLDISATVEAGVPCRISSDRTVAQAADVFAAPVCYLEWTALPDEGIAVIGAPPKITGQAVKLGEQRIAWTLQLFDADGSAVVVGGGEQRLTVKEPLLQVQPDRDVATVYRLVEPLSFGMTADRCDIYTDELTARRRSTPRRAACQLLWMQVPTGLTQDKTAVRPLLEGYLDSGGPNTLAWKIAVFSRQGTRLELTPQQYTLRGIDPPAPTVEILPTEKVNDALYAVPQPGGRLGMVTASAPRGGLLLTIETAGQPPQTQRYEPSSYGVETRLSSTIDLPSGALWSRTAVKVKAAYARLESISRSVSVDALYVPPKNVQATLAAPAEILDLNPLSMTLAVGLPEGKTLRYDPAVVGLWKGGVNHKDRVRGELVPLTPVVTLTGGVKTFDVAIGGKDNLVLYGTVTTTSPDGQYQRTLTTLPTYVSVLRGAAPAGTLSANRLSGPAPLRVALSLAMDRASERATGEIRWEMSRDDGGHWEALPAGDNRPGISLTLAAGNYQVRAKVTNRFTGAAGVFDTIAIQAYDIPAITVEGTRVAFTGAPITLTAKLSVNRQPVSGTVEWWLKENRVGSGDTYTFSSNEPMSVTLDIRARLNDAPADDPSAWARVKHAVDIKAPTPPSLRLGGPGYVEVGEAYRFTAEGTLPSPWMSPADYPLRGEWRLPDGQVVSGMEVTYRPTEADADAGRIDLSFTGWIEGYRDTGGTKVVVKRVSVARYVWPEFALRVRQRMAYAPSEVILTVEPVKFTGKLDEPAYNWSLPPQATVVRQENSQVTLQFATAGDYPIDATVTDRRGHRTPLSATVTVLPATPYMLTLDLRPSNKWNRAPLDGTVYVYDQGGHPNDRPAVYRYFMDGSLLEETPLNSSRFRGLKAGLHRLRVEMESMFGASTSQSLELTVADNQPPLCQLNVDPRSGYYRLKADCSDSDGMVAGYLWQVDGQRVSVTGNLLTLNRTGKPQTVQLTATDDAGGQAVLTQNLLP